MQSAGVCDPGSQHPLQHSSPPLALHRCHHSYSPPPLLLLPAAPLPPAVPLLLPDVSILLPAVPLLPLCPRPPPSPWALSLPPSSALATDSRRMTIGRSHLVP